MQLCILQWKSATSVFWIFLWMWFVLRSCSGTWWLVINRWYFNSDFHNECRSLNGLGCFRGLTFMINCCLSIYFLQYVTIQAGTGNGNEHHCCHGGEGKKRRNKLYGSEGLRRTAREVSGLKCPAKLCQPKPMMEDSWITQPSESKKAFKLRPQHLPRFLYVSHSFIHHIR